MQGREIKKGFAAEREMTIVLGQLGGSMSRLAKVTSVCWTEGQHLFEFWEEPNFLMRRAGEEYGWLMISDCLRQWVAWQLQRTATLSLPTDHLKAWYKQLFVTKFGLEHNQEWVRINRHCGHPCTSLGICRNGSCFSLWLERKKTHSSTRPPSTPEVFVPWGVTTTRGCRIISSHFSMWRTY